jgi:hypothetical protein
MTLSGKSKATHKRSDSKDRKDHKSYVLQLNIAFLTLVQ